jgi:hypothetical protein
MMMFPVAFAKHLMVNKRKLYCSVCVEGDGGKANSIKRHIFLKGCGDA